MKYSGPLVPGRFLRRYKRFFCDVRLADGTEVTAHCANTGAMTGCTAPLAPVRLSHNDDPRRKLRWSLEQIQVGEHWILAHTARPNRIVREALEEGRVPALAGYTRVRSEVRVEDARIDLRLESAGRPHAWVEVKNVTLLEADGVLRFPDAVTTRGTHHLDVLRRQRDAGDRAVLFLHVGHAGGAAVEPARHIDPGWGDALDRALAAGVEVMAWRTALSATDATLVHPVPFRP